MRVKLLANEIGLIISKELHTEISFEEVNSEGTYYIPTTYIGTHSAIIIMCIGHVIKSRLRTQDMAGCDTNTDGLEGA